MAFIGVDLIAFCVLLCTKKRNRESWDKIVYSTDKLLQKGFCTQAARYSLHSSNYQHILLAHFRDGQTHNLFEFDGQFGDNYDDIMKWEKGSILIIVCCLGTRTESHFINEQGYLSRFLQDKYGAEQTKTGRLFNTKEPQLLALSVEETAVIKGGILAWPWHLRTSVFGTASASLSYLL